MKKLFMLGLVLATTSTSFAGAGGYTTINCSSASGRTMVSIYMGDENLSMNLLVDGKLNTYDTNDTKADISFAGNEDVIIVKKNRSIQVSLSGEGANRELHILEGSDPRIGTDIDHVAKKESQKIAVSCKSFTKEP